VSLHAPATGSNRKGRGTVPAGLTVSGSVVVGGLPSAHVFTGLDGQAKYFSPGGLLLRETDRSVTDICLDVGFTSLGTFSRTFREIVGETPSAYRSGHGPIVAPNCVQMLAMRPLGAAGAAMRSRGSAMGSSSFGEAGAAAVP